MTIAEYLIQHQRTAAENAARATQDDTLITRVASSLPPGLEVERLSAGGYCARVRLTLPPVPTMAQNAAANLAVLPARPLARVKDGSLTFKPLADVTDRERERGDVTEVAPVILKHEVAPFYPMGEQRELAWWTTVDGLPVEVHALLLDRTASTITIHTTGFGRTKKHQSTVAACAGARVDRYWTAEPATHASVIFSWDAPRAEGDPS